MKNNEIIKRAQSECGEYVTGYKADITADTIIAILEAMWSRAKNLTYCFTEWSGEVLDVVGQKNYEYWHDEIQDFENRKMQEGKYYRFHGERFCA